MRAKNAKKTFLTLWMLPIDFILFKQTMFILVLNERNIKLNNDINLIMQIEEVSRSTHFKLHSPPIMRDNRKLS